MWLMLQADPVDDFVLASGRLHTVKDLVSKAFKHVGLDYKGFVTHDASLVKAVEPMAPCGNPAKAKRLLGWENEVPLEDLIGRLIDSELKKLR